MQQGSEPITVTSAHAAVGAVSVADPGLGQRQGDHRAGRSGCR